MTPERVKKRLQLTTLRLSARLLLSERALNSLFVDFAPAFFYASAGAYPHSRRNGPGQQPTFFDRVLPPTLCGPHRRSASARCGACDIADRQDLDERSTCTCAS